MIHRSILALAASVLVVACSGEPEGVVVEMFDNRFSPAELTVEAGTEVIFRGAGRNPHNAVYITTMQPRVAFAQAEMLNMVATAIEYDDAPASVIRTALAVARAVLGETDTEKES